MIVLAKDLRAALRFVKPWPYSAEPYTGMVLVERNADGLRVSTDASQYWLSATMPGRPGSGAVVVALADLDRIASELAPALLISISSDQTPDGSTRPSLSVRSADVEPRGQAVIKLYDREADEPRGQAVIKLYDREADGMRADAPTSDEVVKLDIEALGEVTVAASKDDARPILCQVCVTPKIMACTDSYRLHLRRVKSECPPILIPAKVAKRISTLSDPTIAVSTEDWFLVASDATRTVATWFLNGASSFPKFARVVPKKKGPEFIRFGPDLKKALIALRRAVPHAAAVFEAADDGLKVWAKPHLLLAPRGKPAPSVQKKPWSTKINGEMSVRQVGFNPKFLTDLIGPYQYPELRGSDPLSAWAFTEEAPGGQRVRVLMPVRV